jgi:hypothetical protein
LNDGIYRRQNQPPPPPPEQSSPPQSGASASASAPASAPPEASSDLPSDIPSFSFGFRQPSADNVRQSPGSKQYLPPGGTHFHEENYHTNEQRPLFKPERHTFDATPKTEQWMIFRASFDAAVGSRRMADSAKLLMLLDLLGGEPKKIAQRIAGEEYNTRSYIQVWHTLEEHYGGLNRAKKDILHKLKTFPKIAKFNKDNALKFSSLILNILNKYANQGQGLINEGGVLSSLAKKIIPEHEVVTYFQKLAEYDKPENLLEFYKFIEQKRIALNLASAHFGPAPKQGSASSALMQLDDDLNKDTEDHNSGPCYRWQQNEPGKEKGLGEVSKLAEPKSTEIPPCPLCKAKHKLFQCDDFKALTTNKCYYATRDAGCC